jgi:hypothetical protein
MFLLFGCQATAAVLLVEALKERSKTESEAAKRADETRLQIAESERKQREVEFKARMQMAQDQLPFTQRTTAYTQDRNLLDVPFKTFLSHIHLSPYEEALTEQGYTEARDFAGVNVGRLLNIFKECKIPAGKCDAAIRDLLQASPTWWESIALEDADKRREHR